MYTSSAIQCCCNKYEALPFCLSLTLFAEDNTAVNNAEPLVPPIKVIYFVPADREASDDAAERIGRVMKYIQDWYRKEMERNGCGSKTFGLEWEEADSDKLKLYHVKGTKNTKEYDRINADMVWEDCKKTLEEAGIDREKEVILILHDSLTWTDGKSYESLPVHGGGNHLMGRALAIIDKKIDVPLLSSKEPGGSFFGDSRSLGKFNTVYFGGIAHELGHAFGLPHCGETQWEKENLGTSLMGSGNHTFGNELRGEGKGTFMHKVTAMRLAKVRSFAGDLPGNQNRGTVTFQSLEASFEENPQTRKKEIVLNGSVDAEPKLSAFGVFNEKEIPSEDTSYDAKTYDVQVDEEGRFRAVLGELEPRPYKCTLRMIHENGSSSEFSIRYLLREGNNAELDSFNVFVPMNRLKKAFLAKDKEQIQQVAREFKNTKTFNVQQWAEHFTKILDGKLINVAALPDDVKSADLTFVELLEEKTSFDPFCRGWLLNHCYLTLDGQLFSSGFFAHAESNIKVDLDGKWDTFDFGFGIQDSREMKLRFTVRGDGRILFSKEVGELNRLNRAVISIKGVKTLELNVVPDRIGAGWSIWVDPILRRW